MRISAPRLALLFSFSTLTALSTGCAKSDRLTRDNYNHVQIHASSKDDVRAALGEPSEILGDDQWLFERPEKHLRCLIDFDDKGRVTRTQWIDAMTNTWHDSKESKPK